MSELTVDDVLAEIAYIKSIADDYEAAHGAEDALHVRVLSAIAEGHSNPAAIAAAAMKTGELDFDRYCA